MVEFSVTSEGCCTLNTSRGEQVLAGHIFGGDFGSIEPGNSMTVSLVWPTVVSMKQFGYILPLIWFWSCSRFTIASAAARSPWAPLTMRTWPIGASRHCTLIRVSRHWIRETIRSVNAKILSIVETGIRITLRIARPSTARNDTLASGVTTITHRSNANRFRFVSAKMSSMITMQTSVSIKIIT